jgi:hypothetical protein
MTDPATETKSLGLLADAQLVKSKIVYIREFFMAQYFRPPTRT